MLIPTTRAAFFRKKWLQSEDEIIYDGPDLNSIIKRDFLKVPVSTTNNIALKFVLKRIPLLKKFERRPVFDHILCTGCQKCVNICPVQAIMPLPSKKTHIHLTDSKCIRCFCCSEVCTDNAVEIRRKVFGVVETLHATCLNVYPCIFCMRFDEFTSRWHLVAHEHREDMICFSGAFYCNLSQCSCLRIHGC